MYILDRLKQIFFLVKLILQLRIGPVESTKTLLGQVDVGFLSVVGVEGVFYEEGGGGDVLPQHVFLVPTVRHLLEVLRAGYDVPQRGEWLFGDRLLVIYFISFCFNSLLAIKTLKR